MADLLEEYYTLSQIINHYDRSNPLSPKFKSARHVLETPDALCTATSDLDIFTYCEKTSTRYFKFYHKCNQITRRFPFPPTPIYEKQSQRLQLQPSPSEGLSTTDVGEPTITLPVTIYRRQRERSESRAPRTVG